MDFEKARFNMVEQQVRPWDVLNPRVLAVISEIPREQFVPDEYKNLAYVDTRIPLGTYEDQPCTMANPTIDGRILQEMDIQDEDLILEIGTGSGYLTACLAKLGRHVDSVDINEDMTAMAEKNLQALNINNVNLVTGDASKTWEQKHNYDVIVISAAMKRIPQSYRKLLKNGGRMFVVTGKAPAMTAHRVTRIGKNEWTTEDLFETSIEPMIEPVEHKFIF
ncbi:MAG: protein-L-isoaspartate O-methyltransferase [Gammaproteobacteria bacterium]|jgi:protein-L-isoaspartate(D-aspartate) O-methyltransferase|nr:protein-L-isoaspartate O-methyltransferase [Gammaproteobacteria bacterium]